MKVLHVSYAFSPDPVGGTEVYVTELARDLSSLGVEWVVSAPARDDNAYDVEGLRVRRFACDEDPPIDVLYGAGDPRAAASFERLLRAERPDVVHQHAWSPACSTALVRTSKQRGIPVVFTYHTPTVTCQRGTLLRWGSDPCRGLLDARACTACVLDGLGANAVVRGLVGSVPGLVAREAERRGWQGGLWTAVRLPRLMATRIASTRELLELVDRWVSVTPWVVRLLRENGVPADRIVVSPHGAGRPAPEADAQRPGAGPVRLAYFGRIDPTKGVALLFEALAQMPGAALELDVYGIRQSHGEPSIYTDMTRLAAADARVRLLPAVPHARVAGIMPQYDAVVVPSQWFETGPLVVLEAFAAGVPVVGSAIGGLADKIRHGVNGLLVEPFHAASAWAATLHECVSDRGLLPRLRLGVEAPRSMRDVATEMHALYREVAGAGTPVGADSNGGRS